MKKPFLFTLSIVSAFSLMFATPTATYGCSCMIPGDPDDAINEAAAVFAGEVLEVGEAVDGMRTVLFDADRAWKGVATSNIAVTTPQDSAGCGVDFQRGREYIVYATQDENGMLTTSLCSRTHEITNEETDEDLQVLGAAMPVAEVPTPESERRGRTGAIVAIALIALAVTGYLALRKRNATPSQHS